MTKQKAFTKEFEAEAPLFVRFDAPLLRSTKSVPILCAWGCN
jgi:hypothetical protein